MRATAFPKMPALCVHLSRRFPAERDKVFRPQAVGGLCLHLLCRSFHTTPPGLYLCQRFVGIQEMDILLILFTPSSVIKNSDAIPRRATCFVRLFRVLIALLTTSGRGKGPLAW